MKFPVGPIQTHMNASTVMSPCAGNVKNYRGCVVFQEPSYQLPFLHFWQEEAPLTFPPFFLIFTFYMQTFQSVNVYDLLKSLKWFQTCLIYISLELL